MTANLFAVLIVLLGLMLAYYGLKSYRVYRDKPWGWLSLAKTLLGLYWAGLYIFVLAVEPGSFNSVLFGQLFVRPAMVITLAVMTSGVMMGSKRR